MCTDLGNKNMHKYSNIQSNMQKCAEVCKNEVRSVEGTENIQNIAKYTKSA